MKGYCQACGAYGIMDRAHIRTRGAGAGWEDDEFIILCRKDHVAQGQLGWQKFCYKYPGIRDLLRSKGWHFIDVFGVAKLQKISVDKP